MLHNNNKSSINKLSNKILRANKLRNIFTILAIALTTLLITTTLSAGITFYKTNKLYMSVSTYGVEADGYINITEEKLEKLKKLKNVKDIGISKLASLESIKNKKLLNERVLLNYADKKAYEMMCIVPMKGTYPKASDEVLVPTWVLDVLGIEKNIGKKIDLEIDIDGKVQTKTFKLSGYYESLVSRASGQTKVFVSEDFITKYNENVAKVDGSEVAYLNLKSLNNKSTKEEAKNEIEKVANEIGATKFKEHPKYEPENSPVTSDNINQFLAIGMGIVIVIFTGYLIIYNIFYISVSKDIRFYGLLKTIGTTSKQLKKIILRQALILSIIGIPIGLVLGYLVADYIVPLVMKETILGNVAVVSKSIYVFILAIAFSLITVYISCSKPGKVAGKVSPVEAVRFVSSDSNTSKKKSKKGTGGAKVHKMAWSNIVKNKKRVCISILSITLSALTIIFTVNATLGLDPAKHADNQVLYDISISNNISHFYGEEEYEPIQENLIDKIKSLDIVKEAVPQYSVIGPEANGKIYDFGASIKLSGKFKEEIESYGDASTGYNGFSYAGYEDIINTQVKSIKADKLDKEVERVKIVDGEINEEEFKKGNHIIYYAPLGKANVIKPGDCVSLTFIQRDNSGKIINEITKEFKIMAVVAENSDGWSANNFGFINIEEEAFKDTFKDYNNYVSSIGIELKDDVDLNEADKEIQELLLDSKNLTLGMLSKNYYVEGIKGLKNTFMVIGTIIGSIVGMIGAINLVNTVFSGIFSRKVEFAMLESIGMTKKQLKKMILFEGIYYILLTTALIIPLGVVVSYVAPMVLPLYSGFNFGIYAISISICITMISILMIAVQFIGYKIVSKKSIVERIRD